DPGDGQELCGEIVVEWGRLAGRGRDVPRVDAGVEGGGAGGGGCGQGGVRRQRSRRGAAPVGCAGGGGRRGGGALGARARGGGRGVGVLARMPDGLNGFSVGPSCPVIAAAMASWSPAECWRTWATFHSEQGVARPKSAAVKAAAVSRRAVCARSRIVQVVVAI